MSNFPNQLDDDNVLPPVNNNLTEIGEELLNALRSAVFAIQSNIGILANGSKASIADRLDQSLNQDGTIKASALTGLGLVVLPITDSQVSAIAGIQESKLQLNYSTQYLYNLYQNLKNSVDVLNGFLSITGIKVEPHIAGTAYRHKFSHLDIDTSASYVKPAPIPNVSSPGSAVVSRDITNGQTLLQDISDELTIHQKADGNPITSASLGGTIPPENYAHMAAGVYVNSANFATIPSTVEDVQSFAEFVDNSSLLLLGTKTQTLFSNGVSRSARATSLLSDNGGQFILTSPATTYLLFSGSNVPVDNFSNGDDVILLNPSSTVLNNNTFDADFALVKPGDIIVVDYGNATSSVAFTIDSTKAIINGPNRTYAVRINGKNLFSSSTATVNIYKSFFTENKYGVLAMARAHNQFSEQDSLIVAHPRSASALGIGFNPEKIDSTHYNLYLTFYPTGNPLEKSINLPPIDITGNKGSTPGKYTLDSLVDSTNNAFRQTGYNYRFIAYSYKGEFGIMLADHYNNASFSIISGTLDSSGNYYSGSLSSYPFNVIDGYNNLDALGFGPNGSGVASPPYSTSYTNPIVAQVPTVILAPQKRKFFYVNGTEKDLLNKEIFTSEDTFGDGYWPATINNKTILGNRVEITYMVPYDLSTSGLKKGKTIVVYPNASPALSNFVDYGRFLISNVVFNNCPGPNPETYITVYDAIHGTGTSPYQSANVGTGVNLYFCDDSVSFNSENVGNSVSVIPFKRHFEILVNTDGKVFSHERARFSISGSNVLVDAANSFTLYATTEMQHLNIYEISPKLRGYKSLVYRKIHLFITDFDGTTGVFNGYLCKFDGVSYTNFGPTTTGKKGEKVRFYDESNIDYIDIIFSFDDTISSFVNKGIDIQLYPSLMLDEEKFFIGSCQVNDSNKTIKYIRDGRTFGNISEKHLSSSALDYISASDKLIHENGVVRGFEIIGGTPQNVLSLTGGVVLVNGKLVYMNETTNIIPILQETLSPTFTTNVNTITWFVCVNDKSEIELVASTDYDLSLSGIYGSLDHNRLFYVKNPNAISPTPYNVRGTYLQNLYVKWRDLVPLYTISATVGIVNGKYAVTTSTITDLRRYVSNGYIGMDHPFVLSPDGSFRSVEALNNWMVNLNGLRSAQNVLNLIGAKVLVKGTFPITSTLTFNYNNKVEFVGDNGTFDISVGTGFNIGNNIEFKNITFNYIYDATSDPLFASSSLINIGKSCINMNIGSSGAKNITIEDCTFKTPYANHFAFIGASLTSNSSFGQNIFIKRNQFISTFVGGGDDLSAAVAFVGPSVSPPVNDYNAPKLINCAISENICNRNQMIAITSSVDGVSGNVLNAISPINVYISDNICGSINYLVRRSQPFNTVNSLVILDKEDRLIIDGNYCKYIYCGDNKGKYDNTSGSSKVGLLLASGLFTSSVEIINNTVSWIQVSAKLPNFFREPMGVCIIRNNKLFASDSSILLNYVNQSSNALNYALVAQRVEGS